MSADSPAPDHLRGVMMRMITGYMRSQAIHVAATLGIADLLAEGPQTAAALAVATGAHGPSLHRLLRALAGDGVFQEVDGGTFSLTPLAELLRSDVPGSMYPRATMMVAEPYTAWGDMLASVQTGEVAFDRVFGDSFFSWMADHPVSAERFNRSMAANSARASAAILDACDFSGFDVIVDVGGGNGSLLADILAAYPKARGVLFDQPHVVQHAATAAHLRGIIDRCEVVGGSFFEQVPMGGDVYLLRNIIHDWDDPRSLTILQTCRNAMTPSTRLMLVESILAPPNEPDVAKWLDLHMLAVLGGQERTEGEYRRLLGEAGLTVTRITPTMVGESVIEAIPA